MKKSSKIPLVALDQYFRATNYLSVAQIFLRSNFLLTKPLEFYHIKSRILGHFGTCPGINFVYTHLNYYLTKHKESILFVLGPGHGFPAIQAQNFVDGTLSHFEEARVPYNYSGMKTMISGFSYPYGFPSHVNPGSPGAILEGGELGYSLSTSFGAVLDNPDLTVACLIGDGEAETGALATSWHCNKFLDPKTSGAVLPILHLNGYKISGPTIFGRMSDIELQKLFEGYGYSVHFVDYTKKENIHEQMANTMETAFAEIKAIQKKARSGKDVEKPAWPMIIMRTLKGWTGVKELKGRDIEGNFAAHQVVLTKAMSDTNELSMLENWLKSYHFEELYNPETGFNKNIQSLIPTKDLRIGMNKHALGGLVSQKLNFPDINKHALDIKKPGTINGLAMHAIGKYLKEVFEKNKNNFRIFSPDETYSNKLHNVFETTSRAWQWPLLKHDEDMSRDGRVIEMLSEHTLQGLMQGYILTGRYGVFPSYEAFLQIVSSMTDQYAKFLKASFEVSWRLPVPSFNYILSSLGWRQDHNGYSHQNPSFISNILAKHGNFASVYFPVDVNSALAVMEECLHDSNCINVIVCEKQEHLQWLTLEQARKQVKEGLAIWHDFSDNNPDIVFSSAGDYPTIETIAAINFLKKEFPKVKVRYVNIMELTSISVADPRSNTTKENFESYYTKDKPVIFNYHGYRGDIKQLLFDSIESDRNRFVIH